MKILRKFPWWSMMWGWGLMVKFFLGSLWPWAWELGSRKTWCRPCSGLGCIRPKGLTKGGRGSVFVPDLSLRTESKFCTPGNDYAQPSFLGFLFSVLGFILTVLEWVHFFLSFFLFPIEPLHLPNSCVYSTAFLQRYPRKASLVPFVSTREHLLNCGLLIACFYAILFPF